MNQDTKNGCILSVIVPVYNVQDYIGECLKSLCAQGFLQEEYEILCVNDGSTDRSADIIKAMSLRFPQIRLIEQKNKGVSSARNTGIVKAKGKFLFFCDGDDFLDPYCLKSVVELCLECDAISASFGFRTVQEHTKFSQIPMGALEFTWKSGSATPFYSGNIWRFVFCRDFIIKHGIKFKEGMRYAEDELFLYHVCRFLDFHQHIYIKNAIYNYRNRPTSAVHQTRSLRLKAHYLDMIEMALEYKKYLEKGDLSMVMRKGTQNRLKYAISNSLQDAMILAEKCPTDTIRELRRQGLYPYGFHFDLLKINHPKTMLANYAKFLFPIPLYYIAVSKMVQMLKKWAVY